MLWIYIESGEEKKKHKKQAWYIWLYNLSVSIFEKEKNTNERQAFKEVKR